MLEIDHVVICRARSDRNGMRKKAIRFSAVDSVEVDSVDESVGTKKIDSTNKLINNKAEVGHHFTSTTYL